MELDANGNPIEDKLSGRRTSVSLSDGIQSVLTVPTPTTGSDNPFSSVEELSERQEELRKSKVMVDRLIENSQYGREEAVNDLSVWNKDSDNVVPIRDRIRNAQNINNDIPDIEIIDSASGDADKNVMTIPNLEKMARSQAISKQIIKERMWMNEHSVSEKMVSDMLEKMRGSFLHLKDIKETFSKVMEKAKSVEELRESNLELENTIRQLQVNIGNVLLENKNYKDRMVVWKKYIRDKDDMLVTNLKREESQVKKLRTYIRQLQNVYDKQEERIDNIFADMSRSGQNVKRFIADYRRSKAEHKSELPEKVKKITEKEIQKHYTDINKLHELVLKAQVFIFDENGMKRTLTFEDLEKDPQLLSLKIFSPNGKIYSLNKQEDMDSDLSDNDDEENSGAVPDLEEVSIENISSNPAQDEHDAIDKQKFNMIEETTQASTILGSMMERCQISIISIEDTLDDSVDETQNTKIEKLKDLKQATIRNLSGINHAITNFLRRVDGGTHLETILIMKSRTRELKEGLSWLKKMVTGFVVYVKEMEDQTVSQCQEIMQRELDRINEDHAQKTKAMIEHAQERLKIESSEVMDERIRDHQDEFREAEKQYQQQLEELKINNRKLQEERYSLESEKKQLTRRCDELTHQLLTQEEVHSDDKDFTGEIMKAREEVEEYKRKYKDLEERLASIEPTEVLKGSEKKPKRAIHSQKDGSRHLTPSPMRLRDKENEHTPIKRSKADRNDREEKNDVISSKKMSRNASPSPNKVVSEKRRKSEDHGSNQETSSESSVIENQNEKVSTPQISDNNELQSIVQRQAEKEVGKKESREDALAEAINFIQSLQKEKESAVSSNEQTTEQPTKKSTAIPEKPEGNAFRRRTSINSRNRSSSPMEDAKISESSFQRTEEIVARTEGLSLTKPISAVDFEKKSVVISAKGMENSVSHWHDDSEFHVFPTERPDIPPKQRIKSRTNDRSVSPGKGIHPVKESRYMKGNDNVESLRHKRWLEAKAEILKEQERKFSAMSHLSTEDSDPTYQRRPMSDRQYDRHSAPRIGYGIDLRKGQDIFLHSFSKALNQLDHPGDLMFNTRAHKIDPIVRPPKHPRQRHFISGVEDESSINLSIGTSIFGRSDRTRLLVSNVEGEERKISPVRIRVSPPKNYIDPNRALGFLDFSVAPRRAATAAVFTPRPARKQLPETTIPVLQYDPRKINF